MTAHDCPACPCLPPAATIGPLIFPNLTREQVKALQRCVQQSGVRAQFSLPNTFQIESIPANELELAKRAEFHRLRRREPSLARRHQRQAT